MVSDILRAGGEAVVLPAMFYRESLLAARAEVLKGSAP